MSIECNCPNPLCRKRYFVPDAKMGKNLKCKACGETFVANASQTQADDFTEPARGDSTKPTASATVTATAGPTAIGRFTVLGKLGSGAFGTVYRARDPQLDREVALKVPNAEVTADAKRTERFLREAKAAAKLQHPHIVPVFDAGKDGDNYYIASAFIDGHPLADSIPEGGTEFVRAARRVRELAEALAYAHEQRVVHRDVKPANIMLDDADHVHLMDFGLASFADEGAQLTTDGAIMGTPAYMSPEQARGQKGEPQPAMDQYAAGVVLYELLTGSVPFKGPTPVVLHNVIHTDPEPPRKSRPNVPKDLETICLKAMSKAADARYPSCQAMADDLRRWLEGEPIAARRMSARERTARWVKKEPKLAGAMAAIALVLLISVLVVSDAARKADAALNQAKKNEADRFAAEERERQSASKEFGALGTAAEERRKANNYLEELKTQSENVKAFRARIVEEQKKSEALQATIIGEQNKANVLQAKVAEEQVKAAALQARINRLEPNFIVLRGHTDSVHSASFSSDGARVVTTSTDGTARVWDAKTGAEVVALKTGGGSASFSPNGTRIVTVGNKKAQVWDAKTGAEAIVLKLTEGDRPHSASFSPDGTRVVTAGAGKSAKVWDAETGAQIAAFTGHSDLKAASFSPDGARFLAAGEKVAWVWDSKTGSLLLTLKGHTDYIMSASFSPDGTRIVTAGYNGSLRVWSSQTGDEVLKLGEGQVGYNYDYTPRAVFSPDGTRIVIEDNHSGRLTGIWDVKTGVKVITLKSTKSASFSPDGTRMVVRDYREGQVLDVKTGAEIAFLRGHTYIVNSVSFSPDGTRVVTACNDKTARIWDVPK